MELVTKTVSKRPTCFIGYSGGLDSECLLHWVIHGDAPHFRQHYELVAVHVHHGLSPHADGWVEHCRQTCHIYNIPLHVVRVEIDASHNIEAHARSARYAVFTDLLQDNDIVLTAHHQRDQAETFLLQALRGGGIAGLASMPYEKKLGKGHQLRPLLAWPRDKILNYANEHALTWIEDESNQSTLFDRNFLRLSVMPLLRERWPAVDRVFSRNAEYLAEHLQLSHELAAIDYSYAEANQETLNIEKLQELSEIRRVNLLRYWLREAGCTMPSEVFIQRILTEVVQARSDAMPLVEWQGGAVRRYQQHLYIVESAPITKGEWQWNGEQPLLINGYQLTATSVVGKGLAKHKLPTTLTIRFRQGGETLKPKGHDHHRDLKKLFQEWGIPPWQRDRIPLVYIDTTLIMVVNYAVADEWSATLEEEGILFAWSKP